MNSAWFSRPAWLLASGNLARVGDARVSCWEGPWSSSPTGSRYRGVQLREDIRPLDTPALWLHTSLLGNPEGHVCMVPHTALTTNAANILCLQTPMRYSSLLWRRTPSRVTCLPTPPGWIFTLSLHGSYRENQSLVRSPLASFHKPSPGSAPTATNQAPATPKIPSI